MAQTVHCTCMVCACVCARALGTSIFPSISLAVCCKCNYYTNSFVYLQSLTRSVVLDWAINEAVDDEIEQEYSPES